VFPVDLVSQVSRGFLAGIPEEDWEGAFDRYCAGEENLSRRLMLEISLERDGREIFSAPALNDAVFSAQGIVRLIRLRVETGDEALEIARYRSDGLIIATPTGSTAHSAAAGGPILDPEVEGVIITPICPAALSSRSVVLPSHLPISVEVEEDQRAGVLLTVDGQLSQSLQPRDRIRVRKAPFPALLLASDRRSFYRALQTKLSWSGGSHA
jgi:NAD+ kinase